MILVETKFYPLVLISYRGQDFSEAEHREMLATLETMGRRAQRNGTRHVAISLGATGMSATERQTVARLMADFPQELLDLYLGSYVVVANPAVRGMLAALRWLTPKLVMVEPVSTIEAGLAAARAQLEKHGIPVNEDLVRGAQRWLTTEDARRGQLLAT